MTESLTGSGFLAGDVEAVLDLRSWTVPMDGGQAFADLWSELEPTLYGRPLRGGATHSWDADSGTITLEIVRVAPGVTELTAGTRVDLVAVRERARLVHRCASCDKEGRDGYGVFQCGSCAATKQPDRVCVDHVVMLDGALTPYCDTHRPLCRGCGTAARFWCTGSDCRNSAWCESHRVPHPQNPDIDYCPGCYRLAFPVCEEHGCSSVGTVNCDWSDARGAKCGRQACPKHARRWQVFGSEKIGLGLCRAHSHVQGQAPEELLFQICAGGARRGDKFRLPSLPAFGFNLRNSGHRELAPDYPAIRRLLENLRQGARRDVGGLGRVMDRAAGEWDRELERLRGNRDEGERMMRYLRQLVVQQDPARGADIAAAIQLQELIPAKTAGAKAGRPALLWVLLPDELRGRFIGPQGSKIRLYSEQLGVEIKLADLTDRQNQRGRR